MEQLQSVLQSVWSLIKLHRFFGSLSFLVYNFTYKGFLKELRVLTEMPILFMMLINQIIVAYSEY